MQDLLNKLASMGFTITPEFNSTVQRDGTGQKLFFIGQTKTDKDGNVYRVAQFGDHSLKDSTQYWTEGHADGTALTDEELSERRAQAETDRIQYLKEKQELHESTAAKATIYFDGLLTEGSTPYLARKYIKRAYGARFSGTTIVVPIRDIEGKLWSYQRIDADGSKRFAKGGRIDGCFHRLLSAENNDVFVCEGFATAASVGLIVEGKAHVICAFNAQNIIKVCREWRRVYPDAKITIAADNDCHKENNAGLIAATQAANECGCEVRYPVFLENSRGTDFNDLYCEQGLEVLRAHLEKAQTTLAPNAEAKKPKRISDYQANQEMQRKFGDQLLKYGEKDFFYWNGKHWDHLVQGENDFLYQQMAKILGPKASNGDIHSAVQYFSKHCQKPPRGLDMLMQNFSKANFGNGTLHATWNGQAYYLEFKAHNQYDYLTSMLPFDFPLPPGRIDPANLGPLFKHEGKLKEFIDELFQGEHDAVDKVQSLSELFGCALMPTYSRIFMLLGPPASGKSTVAKLLTTLVGEENVSRVSPSDLAGFNLASTVGKRLNVDLDLSLRKPIEEEILKAIVDMAPFRIARKFLPDLVAPLPPIHVYCGNGYPKTLEGSTDAFDRRVIILRFGATQKTGENFTWNYERIVWEQDAASVVWFAVHGLIQLLAKKGHFAKPQSSISEVNLWTKENDLAEQFIEDMKKGMFDDSQTKLHFVEHPEARIDRKLLSEMWVRYSRDHNAKVGRNHLIKRMRAWGYNEVAVQGKYYFKGIGIGPTDDAVI